MIYVTSSLTAAGWNAGNTGKTYYGMILAKYICEIEIQTINY
jgi:hypothetical protein